MNLLAPPPFSFTKLDSPSSESDLCSVCNARERERKKKMKGRKKKKKKIRERKKGETTCLLEISVSLQPQTSHKTKLMPPTKGQQPLTTSAHYTHKPKNTKGPLELWSKSFKFNP